MRKPLILIVGAALVAVGCGGGSSSSSTPVKLSGTTTNKGTKNLSGTSIDVEMDDYYFSPTFIKGGTPGSTVTVHLKNEGKSQHTFTSAALGVDQAVAPDSTMDVQVTLPPSGATEFHCRFHQQSNGMQGAFYFKDGDAVGATGAAPTSSSSSSVGGYDYN